MSDQFGESNVTKDVQRARDVREHQDRIDSHPDKTNLRLQAPRLAVFATDMRTQR